MTNQFDRNNFVAIFRTIQIVFGTLALGQIFILAVFLLTIQNRSNDEAWDLNTVPFYVVPIIGITAMFLSRYVYNQNLLKVAPTESVIEKLGKYRTFKIISWAILEGAGLFSLIAFYITSNYLYVIIFILIFVFFLLNRPSREGFDQGMQLSVSGKDTLFKD